MTLRGERRIRLALQRERRVSAPQAQYAKAQLELFEAWYRIGARRRGRLTPCASSIPIPRASRPGSSSQGGPDLGSGPLVERRRVFRRAYDGFRTFALNEPRGFEAVVGALLCEPAARDCAAGLIFFNNAGYLGMCGHATIGAAVTLAHMGRLAPGAPVRNAGGIVTWSCTTARRQRSRTCRAS